MDPEGVVEQEHDDLGEREEHLPEDADDSSAQAEAAVDEGDGVRISDHDDRDAEEYGGSVERVDDAVVDGSESAAEEKVEFTSEHSDQEKLLDSQEEQEGLAAPETVEKEVHAKTWAVDGTDKGESPLDDISHRDASNDFEDLPYDPVNEKGIEHSGVTRAAQGLGDGFANVGTESVIFSGKTGDKTQHDSSEGDDAKSGQDEDIGDGRVLDLDNDKIQHSDSIKTTMGSYMSGDYKEGIEASNKPDMVSTSGDEDSEETKKRRHRKKEEESDNQAQDSRESEAVTASDVSGEAPSDPEPIAHWMEATGVGGAESGAPGIARKIVGLPSEQEKRSQSARDSVAKMKSELSNLRSRMVSENLTEQELQELEKKIKEIEGKINELDSDL